MFTAKVNVKEGSWWCKNYKFSLFLNVFLAICIEEDQCWPSSLGLLIKRLTERGRFAHRHTE